MESALNPTRSTYFVVDSRDRDLSQFPLANHYEISLEEAVHDVTTVKLLVADVPFVTYLVDSGNSALQAVVDNGPVLNAVVPTGDYTGAALATAVAAALQSTTTAHTFTASYLTLTDNISVTCDAAFKMTFAQAGSLALELGFAVHTTVTSVPNSGRFTITPPFRRNKHLTPSVILSIYPACVNTSVAQSVNQSFAIITPNRNALSAAGERFPQKNFNPPVARFSRVMIDFLNYDGSPVDFQNHEHRIELLIVSLRAAKYLPFSGLPTQ